jgi:hypothetical protein
MNWHIEQRKLSDLKEYPHNPRVITKKGLVDLKRSIDKFGIAEPIIVNTEGTIIGGHARYQVLKSNGTKEIDVYVPERELSEDEYRELNVRLNKNIAGEWDFDILANEFELPDLIDWGFETSEFDLPKTEIEEDEAEDPNSNAFGEVRVKLGDIWECGKHRILCGDSTNSDDVKMLIAGENVDLIFSDPPYGISIVAANGYVGGPASHMAKTGKPYIAERKKGLGSVGGANMVDVGKYFPVIGDDSTDTAISSYDLLSEMFPSAVHVWWGGNYYANHLPASSCWFVWDKQNTGDFADVELAWTNQKTAVRLFSHMWNGLMKESEKGIKRVHPTQKPIALAEWCFEKYPEASVILDPFLGSGITIMAGEHLGRRVYGIEMSPEYCEVCIRRWETLTGQKAVKANAT